MRKSINVKTCTILMDGTPLRSKPLQPGVQRLAPVSLEGSEMKIWELKHIVF